MKSSIAIRSLSNREVKRLIVRCANYDIGGVADSLLITTLAAERDQLKKRLNLMLTQPQKERG